MTTTYPMILAMKHLITSVFGESNISLLVSLLQFLTAVQRRVCAALAHLFSHLACPISRGSMKRDPESSDPRD